MKSLDLKLKKEMNYMKFGIKINVKVHQNQVNQDHIVNQGAARQVGVGVDQFHLENILMK